MKKLAPLLGFDVYKENDTSDLVIIENFCNFPQERPNCRRVIERIERLIIYSEKVDFPVKIKHWEITIQPTEHNLKKYYSIDGIKKIAEEKKEKIFEKITFIKPELIYPKKMKFPKLIIHFYQIDDKTFEQVPEFVFIGRDVKVDTYNLHGFW